MDIRGAVNEFVMEGKELVHRLQSPEREMLSAVDLYILRVQLHLLDSEAVSLQNLQSFRRKGEGFSGESGSGRESKAA